MSQSDMSKQSGLCPDPETIGAFFDGELPKDAPEATHIAGCAACAKIHADYAFMASALKKRLVDAVPEDLNEKIMSTVRSRVMPPPATVPFRLFALRVAAGLVACAAVISVLVSAWNEEHRSTTSAKPEKNVAIVERTPSTIPSIGPAPSTNSSAEFSARPPGKTMAQGNVTLLTNLKPASFGVQAYEGGATGPDKSSRIARIGDQVRQVWVVKNLDRQAAEFTRLVGDVGGTCGAPVFQRGHAELEASLTKAQLVDLVRRSAAAGFSLTSPAQPQPEQERFVNSADEPVTYVADLVPE